jgi:hypothetical protein
VTQPEQDAGLAWEVLQRYQDPASTVFDAVLAASGVDEATARALRFWQRESVHSVKQFAAHAVPGVLATLAEAEQDGAAACERARQHWREHAPSAVVELAGVHRLEPATTRVTDEENTGQLADQRRRTVAMRLAR